ncbi:hypothetical protein NIES2135_64040 (plasmid) [Leptolyngbya boryana NIES-2135]|jgi:hypothetical protein|uniref:Threonine efflux protein n=1 Tax=Leptolyngbya boryana NIES-2135 TaxID=1973484 RepID=A0A1Z4JS78_LEPBY|nr:MULTISPECIES: ABC-three component system middle component 2 [Leptolyngbya]BAY59527.1 hypothetical protein NIES2135_64040 [Leptolyngbya boryana NIES-2135]MBD2371285.1 threonine transporter [Leptolyngbya sp. FACHB-161]MBD2377763.1 threonine transporter [Leptolyngbya sp. FACHB-238]MBD2402201.1 threonine transporter [Leptolyngbya sp. FACHB-239]MBD2408694.1 threonine transporter [Leptolyngbya sp. FACHB-402]
MAAPFNSPIETGIRSLVILTAVFPRQLDLQYLVYFDYLTVHTGDVGGPESLHASLPSRSGELLVRRKLVEHGILLMMSRQLIERSASSSGFQYVATDSASAFLSMLTSPYLLKLRERANWVATTFSTSTIEDLQSLERQFFREWSSQFQPIERVGEVR